jgi:hypothetical protein
MFIILVRLQGKDEYLFPFYQPKLCNFNLNACFDLLKLLVN